MSAAEAVQQPGAVINGRWRLQHLIGTGGFGHVWAAEASSACRPGRLQHSALKIFNSHTAASIRMEITALRLLSAEPCVPRLLDWSRQYIAVELLGANLSQVRKARAGGRLSAQAAAYLALKCLRAIQTIHSRGLLHRDIKPSNFVLSPASAEAVYVVDFGLARVYVDADGSVRAARAQVGFRGTPRYASMAAHAGRDLGRVDDLWSLWYSVVELMAGQLPWRMLTDRLQIAEMKIKCTPMKLLEMLPLAARSPMLCIAEHLQRLKFESKPDYDYCASCFCDMGPFASEAAVTPAQVGLTPQDAQLPRLPTSAAAKKTDSAALAAPAADNQAAALTPQCQDSPHAQVLDRVSSNECLVRVDVSRLIPVDDFPPAAHASPLRPSPLRRPSLASAARSSLTSATGLAAAVSPLSAEAIVATVSPPATATKALLDKAQCMLADSACAPSPSALARRDSGLSTDLAGSVRSLLSTDSRLQTEGTAKSVASSDRRQPQPPPGRRPSHLIDPRFRRALRATIESDEQQASTTAGQAGAKMIVERDMPVSQRRHQDTVILAEAKAMRVGVV